MASKEQIGTLQKKINKNPNDINSFIKLANLLKDNNEINISLKIIDTGLKLNSRNTLLYKEKIKILYEIQRFSNCIDLLEKKEEKDNEDIVVLLRCYLHTNNFKAIDEALSKYKLSNDNYDILECLGHLNRLKKNYDQAVKNFKKCITLKPNKIDGMVAISKKNTNFLFFEKIKSDKTLKMSFLYIVITLIKVPKCVATSIKFPGGFISNIS